MSEMHRTFAAVEGGGTSFAVAVTKYVSGSEPRVVQRREFASDHDDPEHTLCECANFFRDLKPRDGFDAIGIAMFGPVGLDPCKKEKYGRILCTTPKENWRNVDVLSPLVEACRGSRPLAIKIETDVNAPALAEYLLAQNKLSSVAYITAGTGVGVGLVIHGKPVHGRMHPEGGHVPIQPLPGDKFEGYSWGAKAPFKGCRTVEGMTSSVALTERLEKVVGENNLPRSQLAELEDDHEIWEHAANALANLCVTLILTTSVEKIVLGGGIMNRKRLLEKIQQQTVQLLNGYLELPSDMNELICKSAYGSDVGLIGASILAKAAYEEERERLSTLSDGKLSPFIAGFVHGLVAAAFITLAAIPFTRHKL